MTHSTVRGILMGRSRCQGFTPEDRPLDMHSDDIKNIKNILRIFFFQEHKGLRDIYAPGSSRHGDKVSSHTQSVDTPPRTPRLKQPHRSTVHLCTRQSQISRSVANATGSPWWESVCPHSTASGTCGDKDGKEKRVGRTLHGHFWGVFRTRIFL